MVKQESYPTAVPIEYRGLRADVALAKLLPQLSRNQLSKWIKSGEVTFNNTQLQPKDKILGEETLQWTLNQIPSTQSEPKELKLDIIYEDNDLLIINKPAGLVVHPGAGYHENTLLQGLLFYNNSLQNLPRAGIIHRLDKDTTGLLIIGKTLPAYTQLTRLLKNREIERRYYAVVFGQVIASGRIETAFGRDARNRLKMAVKYLNTSATTREAITEYHIHKRLTQATLLDIKLHTGRTHQIRVHMRHIHHPIIGDPLYGQHPYKSTDYTNTQLHIIKTFPRQALHAYTLKLLHPISHLPLTCEAPIPDDLKYLINSLEPPT